MANLNFISSSPQPTSTPKATTTPVQAPVVKPQPVKDDSKFFSGNLFSKLMDTISVLDYARAGFTKAGIEKKKELAATGKVPAKGFVGFQNVLPILGAAVKGIGEGVANKTVIGSRPQDVNVGKELGIKNETAQQAYNIATSFAMPTLPIGKVAKVANKVPLVSKLTQNLGKVAESVSQFAKKTPAIYKTVEKVFPGFRNPELVNLMKNAKITAENRISELYKQIKTLSNGLTAAERKRVGQLVEGGVSVSQNETKLVAVARAINKITDDLGRESVELWERTDGKFGLNPKSFEELKGKYLPHVFDEVDKAGDQIKWVDRITNGQKLSGKFFEKRKGVEGYMRDFAPAVFKGIATEIKDNEVARAYLQIAQKYGVKAEEITSMDDVVRGAINAVLRDTKKVKDGLGKFATNIAGPYGETGRVSSENIGKYLLDVFDKYLPASQVQTTVKEVKNAKGKKELVRVAVDGAQKYSPSSYLKTELKGKTPQAIEKWVRENGAAFQKLFGYTPDESNLTLVLDKVGDLAGPKSPLKVLKTEKAQRQILEGFGYAPEAITKMHVGKLFENVQLPDEVIDFIQNTQALPAKNVFTATLDKAMNVWKKGKTYWANPAYHVRNVISNQILSDMSTGKGMASTVAGFVEAVFEYFGKGNQKYINAAEKAGLIRKMNFYDGFENLLKQTDLIEKNGLQKFDDFWKGVQNTTEETAKLNVFKVHLEEYAESVGKTVDEVLDDRTALKFAADKANEAIFSPYNIGDGERALMRQIIPFYAFTRQALPFTVKTAVNNPERLIKYQRLQPAIEGFAGDSYVPEEKRPDYQKNAVQLPKGVSKALGSDGPVAVNPQYLYPFGSFSEDFGSTLEKGQAPFGLSFNPFLMEAGQQIFNKDLFTGREIDRSYIPGATIKDTLSVNPQREGSQRLAHLTQTLAPSIYRTVQGKVAPAVAGVPDYAGRDRSIVMAAIDALGFKMNILRPDEKALFDRLDKQTKLKEIQSQIFKVQRDKTLNNQPEARREYLKLLQEEYRKAISQ